MSTSPTIFWISWKKRGLYSSISDATVIPSMTSSSATARRTSSSRGMPWTRVRSMTWLSGGRGYAASAMSNSSRWPSSASNEQMAGFRMPVRFIEEVLLLARGPLGPCRSIYGRSPRLHPVCLTALAAVLVSLLLVPSTSGQEYRPPTSLFDPRFAELRGAAAVWDARRPERRVVDQVCLVPDMATFLEVVATWDGRHFFPVLIEDGEYTPKF